MTNTPTSHAYTTSLDRDWQRLRRRPGALRQARAWADHHPSGPLARTVADIDDLQELLDATRGRSASALAADGLLLELVSIAQDDELAARVVIQRILPGLVSRSARYRSHRNPVDPAELSVAAAWIAVRRYDWRSRGRNVAASLISDATFQAFRRPLRLRAATEELRSPHAFKVLPSATGPASGAEELAGVLRDALDAGVPTHDIELIRHLARTGSPGRVARECGVTPRTIRNRRDRAIARVRAALEPGE